MPSQQTVRRTKKAEVRERDDYKCQFCGVTREQHEEEYGQNLHVHHIVPLSAGGGDHTSNLITACADCHDTLDRMNDPIAERVQNQQFIEDELESIEAKLAQREKRIEELKSLLTNSEFYKRLFSESRVSAEAITVHLGTDIVVTSDHERAIDAYEDFGSVIKRVSLSVSDSDIDHWVEKAVDEGKIERTLEELQR